MLLPRCKACLLAFMAARGLEEAIGLPPCPANGQHGDEVQRLREDGETFSAWRKRVAWDSLALYADEAFEESPFP